MQFYPPLFTNLLLFVDKEAAEHIQYNGEALHETEKIVALLFEKAAAMANHASTRTTQLYDRRRDEVSLDEVERIAI